VHCVNEEAAIRQQTSETRRTALVERTLDPYGQCRESL
jgi:hypothetical protein